MNARDRDLVEHIRFAAERLAEIVASGREAFDSSWVPRSAAERQLEIIGEAAGNLSEDFRASRRDLPAARARAMRNVLAHEYDDIDYDLVWEAISTSVPQLVAALDGPGH